MDILLTEESGNDARRPHENYYETRYLNAPVLNPHAWA